MKNTDIFYIFKSITKEEWDSKSPDWKRGWQTGALGEDINMSDREINAMSEDWKDGLRFVLTHPLGGAVPM